MASLKIIGVFTRTLLATTLVLSAGTVMAETRAITSDIWVDNWFQMYANGTKVLEDSVSITTERSFNAETTTFTAEFPMTVAIMAKDFKENDTGLEYIGTSKQQMGDGGMIAQFKDADTGEVVAVTNSDMRCLVIHHAPVDISCKSEKHPVAGQAGCAFEETDSPTGWTAPGFDDSGWPNATQHSVKAVRPKQGYDRIDWDSSAQLVWSDNLVQDNTLLCRVTIGGTQAKSGR